MMSGPGLAHGQIRTEVAERLQLPSALQPLVVVENTVFMPGSLRLLSIRVTVQFGLKTVVFTQRDG